LQIQLPYDHDQKRFTFFYLDKNEGVQSEVAKSLLALSEQKTSANQGTSQDKGKLSIFLHYIMLL
jgi:hypothetical protein